MWLYTVRKQFILVIRLMMILQLDNDPKRRDHYIARTSKQDHSKQNIASPAWMSRFILWEKPTLKGAVESANNKYKDINIKLK